MNAEVLDIVKESYKTSGYEVKLTCERCGKEHILCVSDSGLAMWRCRGQEYFEYYDLDKVEQFIEAQREG